MNHYREAFYRGLGETLTRHGVDFEMIHGDPSVSEASKRDSVAPAWATRVPNRVVSIKGREIVWQPLFRHMQAADLVIVEQASRLLLNYLLLGNRLLGRRPRLALIGHGENRASDPHVVGEAVKARLTRRADWFFAYTESTKELLETRGFPSERITVFQNTIDTGELRDHLDSISDDDIADFRQRLGVGSEPLVLTLGSLYPDKRPQTAIDAVAAMRREVRRGHLLIVGSGDLESEVATSARSLEWLHHRPAQFGRDKALALASADVLLIPGVAGLVVIDGLVSGRPIVTSRNPHHPPEIDYVTDGVHGLITSESSAGALGSALASLTSDDEIMDAMGSAALERGSKLTVAEMIDRFADGVLAALGDAGVEADH